MLGYDSGAQAVLSTTLMAFTPARAGWGFGFSAAANPASNNPYAIKRGIKWSS